MRRFFVKFGRTPKPGARPLIILRTFGPVSFVYELEDTEGKKFPQELLEPFKPKGEISYSEFARFTNKLFFNGLAIFKEQYNQLPPQRITHRLTQKPLRP